MMALLATVALGATLVELGDSNANSTRVDTIWGGLSVQAGWVYVHNGTSSSTWPVGNAPGVGKLPYLVDLAGGSGCVIRRATNGSHANVLTGQLAGAVLDVAAFGCDPPSLLVVDMGVNDGRRADWAAAYGPAMAELIADADALWPGVQVVLAREDVSDAAASSVYPYVRPVVYPALEGLGVPWVDGSLCDRVDAVHWSTGGLGGGQECVAGLIWAVLP